MANTIEFNNDFMMSFSAWYNRVNPTPLDKSSVFMSLAEAEDYAANSPIAYPGQIVAVVLSDKVDVYKINNHTLEPLGAKNAVISTYEDLMAQATSDNIGNVVYVSAPIDEVSEGDDAHPAYGAGAYIVTGEGGVMKLAQSTATGDYAADIAALQANKQDNITNDGDIIIVKKGGEGDDKDELVAKLKEGSFDLAWKKEIVGEGEDAHEVVTNILEVKTGETVIDSIDLDKFAIDGILESVTYVEEAEDDVAEEAPYLKFVFNTDADKEPIRVSVKKLVDVFDGSSLALSDAYADVTAYDASVIKAGASVDAVAAQLKQGIAEAQVAADKANDAIGSAPSEEVKYTQDEIDAAKAIVEADDYVPGADPEAEEIASKTTDDVKTPASEGDGLLGEIADVKSDISDLEERIEDVENAISFTDSEYIESEKLEDGSIKISAVTKSLAEAVGMYYNEDEQKWYGADNVVTEDGLVTAADIAKEITDDEKVIAAALNELKDLIDAHHNNADIHVTIEDKAKWNAAEQNAKDYALALVQDEDGNNLFDEAGAAEAVQDNLDDLEKYIKGDPDSEDADEKAGLEGRIDAVENAVAATSGVMHFKGVLTPTEGQSDEQVLATVDDAIQGDVYYIGLKEYAYTGSAWVELGDEGDKSIPLTGDNSVESACDWWTE